MITYIEDGHREIVEAGSTALALSYEVADIENAISGQENAIHLDYTKDAVDIITKFRRGWNLTYPEEE